MWPPMGKGGGRSGPPPEEGWGYCSCCARKGPALDFLRKEGAGAPRPWLHLEGTQGEPGQHVLRPVQAGREGDARVVLRNTMRLCQKRPLSHTG